MPGNKAKILYDSLGRKNGYVEIKCPGCDCLHALNIKPDRKGAKWGFNGDLKNPTFTPSLLVKTGHFIAGQPQPPDCHICDYKDEQGKPWPWPCGICHSFITNGNIKFLNDCTHALAGQTVPLPEFE